MMTDKVLNTKLGVGKFDGTDFKVWNEKIRKYMKAENFVLIVMKIFNF